MQLELSSMSKNGLGIVKGKMHEVQNDASVKTLMLPAGKLVKTLLHQRFFI